MSRDSFDGYRPWQPRKEVINGDDSYQEDSDDTDMVLAEIVSSRIVAIAALITAMKDVPGKADEVDRLCAEGLKLAIEEEKKSADRQVDENLDDTA